MRYRQWWAAVSVGIWLCAGHGAVAQDVVRIGVLKSAGDMGILIADEKGYFTSVNVKADLIAFDASAKMVPALGTGDLDVGGGATAASLFNAIDQKIGVRIVADKGHTAPGYIYQSFIIRKELITSGKFKSYADLKGLKMAQGARGVGPLSILNQAAIKGGIRYEDVEKVFLSFPQQIAALGTGAIDGSVMNEPFKTMAVEQGFGMEFAPTEDVVTNYELSLLMFGDQFRQKRADVARRFTKAFLLGVRDYNRAIANGRWRTDGGADEVIGIFAKRLDMPLDLVKKITPPAMDPDGKLFLESIRTDLKFFQDQDEVKNKALKVEDCIDLSFAQAAAAELGPFKP